ncbi:MAG: tRNA uridine-5-carboxymethylaminomethyl(34) synthesis GTPase MnmE [Lachnospiraceae bacterium]|nr:tRNA uridine-5-carboxymethylaminomethyl(34) synthesis GTPase MnmE [Lachnospiraceae bacterium]
MEESTIVGIASGVGGGIGIIRISGKDAFRIAGSVFAIGKEGQVRENYFDQIASHTIHYGHIVDEENQVIDEVMVSVMKAPKTYTKEDVIEINCHGGSYILQKVLQLLLKKGATLAEPGEFTKRAFLNGRIDLSQAEAVMKMISSKNDFALQSAMKQLEGSVSRYTETIREELLYEMGKIESALDDPEHYDLSGYADELLRSTKNKITQLESVLQKFDNGRIQSEGINTVIVGKPNAGKSSLLNVLLNEERAIVTDIAGTTRDILQESVKLGNLVLNIIDTAGIHDTDDQVEQIGVDKAKKYVENADFVLFVVDSSNAWTEEDDQIVALLQDKKGVILLNKSDLSCVVKEEDIQKKIDWKCIPFSTQTKEGLLQLQQYIEYLFTIGKIDFNDQIYLTNVRHRDAICQAVEALHRVKESIENAMPEDFYTIDLMEAYQQLGLINGDTASEDLINKIFEEFCMGK